MALKRSLTSDLLIAALVTCDLRQALQVRQSLHRICLRAHRHITFLEESCDDFRNVIQIIGALDLRTLIIIAGGIVETGSLVLSQLQIAIRRDVLRLHIRHCNLLLNLRPFLFGSGVGRVQTQLRRLDVSLELIFSLFGRFKTLCQLLDRLVFVADQRIDKVSLVLLLELLLTHVLDTLVYKFNFITKLLALRILRLKVAFELCQ